MTLSWGLAIATYNRADVLVRCVKLALQQTRPPIEVVICDSSPDWETTRGAIEQCVSETKPDARLCICTRPSPNKRSSGIS